MRRFDHSTSSVLFDSYVANIHEEDTRVYGAGTMHKGVVS